MPLTAAERSEINRQNASKSTGPRSDAGKARSRWNAMKHGLRADALALPNEDPALVKQRCDAWNDFYQPQSPAAQHLVNQCVQATFLADRVNGFNEAMLSKQIREAEHQWDRQQEEEVEALCELMKTDPDTAFLKLVYTAAGCRRLIGRWESLRDALDGRGFWSSSEREEAARLQGFDPSPDALKDCPPAWATLLFGLLTQPEPSEGAINAFFHSSRFPDEYRGTYRLNFVPDREACVRNLRNLVNDQLEYLNAREETLRTRYEDPDRAGAVGRALILNDGPTARLYLRYHTEARTSFNRLLAQLKKELESDRAAAEAAEAEADDAPNEPNAGPNPEPAASVSPIEPNAGPEPAAETSPNEPKTRVKGARAVAAAVSPVEPSGAEGQGGPVVVVAVPQRGLS